MALGAASRWLETSGKAGLESSYLAQDPFFVGSNSKAHKTPCRFFKEPTKKRAVGSSCFATPQARLLHKERSMTEFHASLLWLQGPQAPKTDQQAGRQAALLRPFPRMLLRCLGVVVLDLLSLVLGETGCFHHTIQIWIDGPLGCIAYQTLMCRAIWRT